MKIGIMNSEIANGDGYHYPFFTPNNTDLQIPWEQKKITIYGKKINLPRLTAWYGEGGYNYAGIDNKPNEWTDEILSWKTKVEKQTGYIFNSLLCNYYRDGKDSVSWHSDDEKGLTGVIASLSFGDTRTFQIKNKATKKIESIELRGGDLIVMGERFQEKYLHQVPKRANKTERINLTFRNIIE
jgi:alkylated DNA repair dioxygenase AlkB